LNAEQEERAQRIHREAIVIDTHCDTLMDVEKGVRQLGERSRRGTLISRGSGRGVDARLRLLRAVRKR
jgi:hypothetical protein